MRGVQLSPYQVGNVTAQVYLGLLGGGDRVFNSSTLFFYYTHQFVPLPAAIEQERTRVLEHAIQRAKSPPHNGPVIRLHSINLSITQSPSGPEVSRPILELRPTCWYDYILSNQQIDEPLVVDGRVSSIRQEFADLGRLDFERNVDWVPLSNIFTTSTVLVTTDRYFVYGRRTRLVDNHAGSLAVVAENMHRWSDEPSVPKQFWSSRRTHEEVKDNARKVAADYEPAMCPNPFYTILRGIGEEVAEELVAVVKVSDIIVLDIAWDLGGFNPHFYATVQVPMTSNELQRLIAANRASLPSENTLYLAPLEPSKKLAELLCRERWAEISKGAVLRTLGHKCGYAETDRKLCYE